MRKLFGLAIAAAALTIPTCALAQGASGAADQMVTWSQRPDWWGTISREDMERDLQTTDEGRERLALADRVAALIDQGRCRAAEELAREERDRTMARNVRLICEEGVGLKPRYRQEEQD